MKPDYIKNYVETPLTKPKGYDYWKFSNKEKEKKEAIVEEKTIWKCDKCEFVTDSQKKIKTHVKSKHEVTNVESIDDGKKC